jgi:hypothetical protein
MDVIHSIINWCNDNRGALSLIQFTVTIFLGWVSGIFAALRRKPKFKIRVIEGSSLCTTFETGRDFNNYKTHRTAISLYLRIANIGSAPSVIDSISIAYHNYSFKYTFLWFWLEKEYIILNDFQVAIDDETIKFYPFLTQASALLPSRNDDYLETGKEIKGVVYFDQEDSFDGFYPREMKGLVKIKIRVLDIFGGSHYRIAQIPKVNLSEAQKFNPKFGMTLESLRKKQSEEKRDIGSIDCAS